MGSQGWIVGITGNRGDVAYFAGRRPREFFRGVFRPQDLHRCYRFEVSTKEAYQFWLLSEAYEVMSVLRECGTTPFMLDFESGKPALFVVHPGRGTPMDLLAAIDLAGRTEGGRIVAA